MAAVMDQALVFTCHVRSPRQPKRFTALRPCAFRARSDCNPTPLTLDLLWDLGKASFSLAAAALLVLAPPAPAGAREEVFGPARIVDGDTIVVNDTRIRLFGIDAPESKQSCSLPGGQEYSCGIVAKEALEAKVGANPVRCSIKNKDMYGRSVAICKLVSGAGDTADEDLNAWLVEKGQAVAYRRYSKLYVGLEEAAQRDGKGMWSGSFEDPQQWRKEHPRGKAPSAPPRLGSGAVAVAAAAPDLLEECTIKGNISKAGKLYHVSGGKYYDSVRIDAAAGERFFCSVAEAEAAGWRAAKS